MPINTRRVSRKLLRGWDRRFLFSLMNIPPKLICFWVWVPSFLNKIEKVFSASVHSTNQLLWWMPKDPAANYEGLTQYSIFRSWFDAKQEKSLAGVKCSGLCQTWDHQKSCWRRFLLWWRIWKSLLTLKYWRIWLPVLIRYWCELIECLL